MLTQFLLNQFSNLWITKPDRNLGSNQVVLGGIMFPVSAISIICFMLTGYRARAIAISPLSTRFLSSPSPLIPPTKSIRLSLLRSWMLRMSRRIKLDEIVTSRTSIGSLSLYVPSFAVNEYQLPSKYNEKLCSFVGLKISSPFFS